MLIYILLTEALRAETAKERDREREAEGFVGRLGWLAEQDGWGWPTACLLWLLLGFILFAF